MNFKFLTGKQDMFLNLEPTQLLTLRGNTFYPENVEFCFQFGDDEPVVFATGPNECHIHLRPQNGSNMTFTDNDREFKLFARQRQ
jgi:hypothetical protein